MLTPLGKRLVDSYAAWGEGRVRETFGYAELSPTGPVQAGEFGSWEVTYHVGGIGLSRRARVAMPFKSVSNWGEFQAHDPTADNYFSVECSVPEAAGPLLIEYPFSALWPWSHAATATLDLPLGPGEWIRFKLGDRSSGSRGWRAQLYAEDGHPWSVWVDPLGARHYVQVPGIPPLQVVAGPAAKLMLTAPSTVTPGEPAWLSLRLVDRLDNTATSFRGRVRLEPHPDVVGLPEEVELGEAEGGVFRIEGITMRRPAVVRLEGQVLGTDMAATSNPILCGAEPGQRLYFGDLHCQSNETQGANTAESLFRFGRDVSCIDFMSHQANDWELDQADYEAIQALSKRYNEPGRFVVFPGYEYSADTSGGGDHNVLYLKDDQPLHRSGHFNVYDGSDVETDRYPLSALLDAFRGRDDVIVTPHIGGRPAAEATAALSPGLTPYIEVCSIHGRFEWFAREAIRHGLAVGFMGSSDDHSGRPGAGFGQHQRAGRGGLVGAYATELTRSAIWESLKGRSIYATTGERIILSVGVSGAPMGGEVELHGEPVVSVGVHATRPLWSVEVLRDLEVVYRHNLGVRDKLAPDRVRVAWTAPGFWRRALRAARWDGQLRVEDGRILSARRFAYHSALEPMEQVDDHTVRWVSTTVGDVDGLEIELDRGAGATLRFESGPISADARVADIREGPLTYSRDDGSRLTFEPVPEVPGPLDVRFAFVDRDASPGRHAYWVRVMQEDAEMAWSSPAWVTVS